MANHWGTYLLKHKQQQSAEFAGKQRSGAEREEKRSKGREKMAEILVTGHRTQHARGGQGPRLPCYSGEMVPVSGGGVEGCKHPESGEHWTKQKNQDARTSMFIV